MYNYKPAVFFLFFFLFGLREQVGFADFGVCVCVFVYFGGSLYQLLIIVGDRIVRVLIH